MSTPTQITIYPNYPDYSFPDSGKKLAGKNDPFASMVQASAEQEPTIDDAINALNPLHYIPFVSTVYDEVTGTSGPAAAKILGGALLGGPIGMVAGLFDVIFKEATGHSAGGAAIAALTGEETGDTTEVASVATEEQAADDADVKRVAEADTEILPPIQAAALAPAAGQETQMKLASAITAQDIGNDTKRNDDELLALFGSQPKSAHDSYRKAQFKPYLNDVTTSMMM